MSKLSHLLLLVLATVFAATGACHRTPHAIDPKTGVDACIDQHPTNKAEFEACLRIAFGDWKATQTDAGQSHRLSAVRPSIVNPYWLVSRWDVDPLSRLATCSDNNTCIDSAHPCCTHAEIAARWGTDSPIWRQNTTEFLHSNMAVNPATDEFTWTPIVQNAAQVGFQSDFVQVCSGTMSAVTQLSRGYPSVDIKASLDTCPGLTQPTLIHDTTINCDLWADTNTSGNVWILTHYLGNGATFIPPSGGSDSSCSVANGHTFTAVVPVINNMRYFDPLWEDLADSPDTRPTLYGGNLGVGINSGAGTDTAQVYIGLNGSALNEVAFNSSTMVAQSRLTHGSRAYGYIQNSFFADSAARTTISAFGASIPDVGSSGQPVKLISMNGGRVFLPVLNNVNLYGDVRIVNSALGSGTIVYGNVYIPASSFNQAAISPNQSLGGILYGSPGQMGLVGMSRLVCLAPAATNCTVAGLELDGAFDGYALDDSVTPAREQVHITLLGNTLFNALDSSIAAGGCAGRCIGRAGSLATVLNAIPSSPVPAFASDGGINLIGGGTGQPLTITITGAPAADGSVLCWTSNGAHWVASSGLPGNCP
jgi:hypothetical protein